MNHNRAELPEATIQLQQQLEQWRTTQPERTKLPESFWHSAAELARRTPRPADPAGSSDRPAVAWALESCRLVRDGGLYPPRHAIDARYFDAHRGQAEDRLRLAGHRLAGLLNFALDKPAR